MVPSADQWADLLAVPPAVLLVVLLVVGSIGGRVGGSVGWAVGGSVSGRVGESVGSIGRGSVGSSFGGAVGGSVEIIIIIIVIPVGFILSPPPPLIPSTVLGNRSEPLLRPRPPCALRSLAQACTTRPKNLLPVKICTRDFQAVLAPLIDKVGSQQ